MWRFAYSRAIVLYWLETNKWITIASLQLVSSPWCTRSCLHTICPFLREWCSFLGAWRYGLLSTVVCFSYLLFCNLVRRITIQPQQWKRVRALARVDSPRMGSLKLQRRHVVMKGKETTIPVILHEGVCFHPPLCRFLLCTSLSMYYTIW